MKKLAFIFLMAALSILLILWTAPITSSKSAIYINIPDEILADSAEEEFDYSNITLLKWIGLGKPGTYEEYKTSHAWVPCSIAKMDFKAAEPIPPQNPDILIYIENSLYPQISTHLERYTRDIQALGYQADDYTFSGSAQDLKDHIVSHSASLVGCVLIGNIPCAWYEVDNDFEEYGYAEFPCDLHLMDLDGAWIDADINGLYDNHTAGSGDEGPEIFVARIDASLMEGDEATLVNDYFDKVHSYFMGELTDADYGLTYTEDDWAGSDYFLTDIHYAYPSYQAIAAPNTTRDDYRCNRLPSQAYEFIQLACHSSSGGHSFTRGGWLFSNEVRAAEPKALFYNLFCCSACRFTESNYLGGAYIFNDSESSLAVVGSAKTGSMLQFDKFYEPLGESNKPFGQAFKEWFDYISPCTQTEIYWYYGMTLLGDPLASPHWTYTRPTVVTNEATSITESSAILNGNLENLGGEATCKVWYEYGTTTEYGNETPRVSVNEVGNFSANISSLHPGALYHFRACASNHLGACGENKTFVAKLIYEAHEIDDSAGGDNDGYPEPGESIRMPVTLRNTATAADFLNVNATLTITTLPTAIFSEDFDGSWPGNWTVGDWDNTSGADYWGQSNYAAYSGNYSAYCAEVSDVSGQEYDNDMEAYMYRAANLSAYDSVTLSYYYWLDCESYFDHLDIGYYDGSWHWVKSYDGYSGGWVQDSISISTTATSVGFLFYSDGSVTYEGAYIDDIVLTGYNLVPVPDPYITITDNYEEYGNILAGGIATSFGGYDFGIDPACPADHVVTFNLDVHASNGGPWTDSFNVTIVGRYTLTMAVVGNGTTMPAIGSHGYSLGTVVNITATPNLGWEFVNWTGDTVTIGDVDAASTNITMNGNYSIMANFAEGALAPVWSVGDNWVYNCSYENLGGNTEQDTCELEVTVVGEEAVGDEACYKLSGVFDPPATRDAADMPLTLHIETADLWTSKDHMEYLKTSSAIAELPGLPSTVTWTYPGDYGWPYDVGKTWSASVRVVAGPLDEITELENKVVGMETITVPAGTFECYHIVTYEPTSPDNYTFEHWFNATVVKSDVKMIDRFLWAGEETRVLTSYSVETPPVQYNLTINSTSSGNVTIPGEGTFTCNASEVVDLVAEADASYIFVNWTGDVGEIDDEDSATTNITMNGNYSIMANFEETPVTYNVTVKIEPSTTHVSRGGSFTIDAVIDNPNAMPVAMHNVRLNFDPDYFTVDSASLVDFDTEMTPVTIDNVAGQVDYDPHMPAGTNTTDTWIVSARINCTAKSLVGNSTISWVYTSGPPPRYTKVVKGTTDYLESGNMSLMFNGTVEVVPGTTLEGHVDLQGLPATNITVRFFDPGTQNERMKKYTSTDSNGDFTIGNITPGTYDVGVKGSTSLSNLESGVNLTGGGTTYREFGVLLEGDASGDDYVDAGDFGPLSGAWLSWPGQPSWDARADFSRDSYIDASDFGLLSANWLKWGDCFGWPGNWT